MSNLFSEDWMRDCAGLWNKDNEIVSTLEAVNFSAKIGYGFKENMMPTGLLVVRQGKVIKFGEHTGDMPDWDLRADIEDWRDWLQNGLGVTRFGFVIARKKLVFKSGDHRAMLKAPSLSRAFLRSFDLMGKVKTSW